MSIRPPEPHDDDEVKVPELDFDEDSELIVTLSNYVKVDTVEDVSAEMLNQWPVLEEEP